MIVLRQVVPSDVCLACDGCCRFAENPSVWSPLFLFEEIRELTQKDIVPSCVFSHEGASGHQAARIDLVADGDHFICSCFDASGRKCKIYPSRPLDCQIYPFLLARHEGQAVLAVDTKCPYIREHLEDALTREYIVYLKKFLLSQAFKDAAAREPRLFQEYPSDYDVVAVLPGL